MGGVMLVDIGKRILDVDDLLVDDGDKALDVMLRHCQTRLDGKTPLTAFGAGHSQLLKVSDELAEDVKRILLHNIV